MPHASHVQIHILARNQAGAELPTIAAVGNKACNLMRLAARGLPVPPGLVLDTHLCKAFHDRKDRALEDLREPLAARLGELERITGRCFGDMRRPLLLSVRSGGAVSMPGMMETVLNIGLNDRTVEGLVRLTGNPRLALDSYRRLIAQYGETVAGIAPALFARAVEELVDAQGLAGPQLLDTDGLVELLTCFRALYQQETGEAFPQDPRTQLHEAIKAVLHSWKSERAKAYRKRHGIPEWPGTAVLLQTMVFGNGGSRSGSGVGFTRDPATGENRLYIDFLANAQGEDVVSGRRNARGATLLETQLPAVHEQIAQVCQQLEAEFEDMQDFEFTIENGVLFLLQTRAGKRTPLAAVRIAIDLVEEGIVAPARALQLLEGIDLAALAFTAFDIPEDLLPAAVAVAASAGVAKGRAVFDPQRLPGFLRRGEPVILVRPDTSTDDIEALSKAGGLLTATGARTSHAAVVARQMGKVCLVGCEQLAIDADGRKARLGAQSFAEGDLIALDGNSGAIYLADLPIRTETAQRELDIVRSWQTLRGSDDERNGSLQS